MKQQEMLRLISDWLMELAVLTNVYDAEAAGAKGAKTKMATLAAALETDLPAQVFTKASMLAAGQKFTFFPTYAELRAFLQQWWQDNRPKQVLLPGDDDASLTEVDRIHLAVFLMWRNAGSLNSEELKRPVPPVLTPDKLRERLTTRLGWMRMGALAPVFRYICRHDNEAASIAVRRGWEVEPSPPVTNRTPEELAYVETLVRSLATPPELTRSDFSRLPTGAPQPRSVSKAELLAGYEAQGQGGTLRAQMLREQIEADQAEAALSEQTRGP